MIETDARTRSRTASLPTSTSSTSSSGSGSSPARWQMPCYNTVAADIHAGKYLFKASGFSVKFDGFTTLYEEGRDDAEDAEGKLPPIGNR